MEIVFGYFWLGFVMGVISYLTQEGDCHPKFPLAVIVAGTWPIWVITIIWSLVLDLNSEED